MELKAQKGIFIANVFVEKDIKKVIGKRLTSLLNIWILDFSFLSFLL